jgi:hypothetical protein
MMDVRSSPSRMPDSRAQYWREISAVLALKALGFALIYLLCFGPWNSMEPSAAAMFGHLMSPGPGDTTETTHD